MGNLVEVIPPEGTWEHIRFTTWSLRFDFDRLKEELDSIMASLEELAKPAEKAQGGPEWSK